MARGVYDRSILKNRPKPVKPKLPKLTMNIRNASVVRDPETGRKHDRNSALYKEMAKCLNG